MRLVLTAPNIRNTELSDAENRYFYSVLSNKDTVVSKVIVGAHGRPERQTIATLALHSLSKNTIQIYDTKREAKEYLKASGTAPFKYLWRLLIVSLALMLFWRYSFTTSSSGKTYEWAHKMKGWQLLLDGEQVGRDEETKKGHFGRPDRDGGLEIDDSVLQDVDEILVAYTYLAMRIEKRKDMIEKASVTSDVIGLAGGP